MTWSPGLILCSLTAIALSALPNQSRLAGEEPGPQPELHSVALLQTSRALNEISRKAIPAVVSITTIRNPSIRTGFEGDFNLGTGERRTLGVGSGVVISTDGVILTNEHVIQGAEKVTVTFEDKIKLPAHLLGSDANTDLAVIQLDKRPEKKLTTLTFGDSDQLAVGDCALAIGSPFGLNRTVTSGIISALGRGQLGVLDVEDFIQTDAAINPGNSGGPLLNAHGQMIGINTAIFSQTGSFIGIGFAVPSKTAKKIAEEILLHGRVIRGWLGIGAQDLNADLAHYFKRPSTEGALISQIIAQGPAEKAALKTGDVITQFGNTSIHSAEQLKALIAQTEAGKKIPIEISRDGKNEHLQAAIQEQPLPQKAQILQQAGQSGSILPSAASDLGLEVEDIPREFIELFGIPAHIGALISKVELGSPADDAGLTVGDIILSANQEKIHSAKDFSEFIKSLKNKHSAEAPILYVQKGPDEKTFVPVNLLPLLGS